MVIKSFGIENFKSIKALEIILDQELSVLTGANNSGKTTILEALSLWAECFSIMSQVAKRTVANKFYKGDFILGATNNHYVDFGTFKSVQCPSFADMFYNRNTRNKIKLTATLYNENKDISLEVGFLIISSSQSRYAIKHSDERNFNYALYNRMFSNLPNAIGVYLSSPVANIVTFENFMTEPQISEHLALKDSLSVMRNRLYNLYYQHNLFRQFQQELSYILFGSETTAQITFIPDTDVNKDARVIISYTIKNEKGKKDLALLGSGSLQAIEILLNIFHRIEDKRDLYLILLDEPDSHIHRDIQRRLFEVLHRVAKDNQIVLTTHNEALIRSTPLRHIFHIDNHISGKISCLSTQDLSKLDIAHFKGLYPSSVNPIIKSLNSSAVGLDFVSAIESDLIVFVEGDDDARLVNYLFYQNVTNRNKRIMFWVLGGVTKIFDSLKTYKTFFSDIRNGKTLWEKSYLIFDQDWLIDEHKEKLLFRINDNMSIPVICLDTYTQESVLLTDTNILAQILKNRYSLSASVESIIVALDKAIDNCFTIVRERYKITDDFISRYRSTYLNRMKETFGIDVKTRDIELLHLLEEYYQKVPLYKLATKNDVEVVINDAFKQLGLAYSYSYEDFYSLVQQTDANFNFPMWKQMTDFLSNLLK